MAAQQRNWGLVGMVILSLLVVGTFGAGAGYLWWQERTQRLRAEQTVQDIQGKYDRLQQECDVMKLGSAEGTPLNQSGQPPAVAAVEAQADAPRCERPSLQPFKETLRKQDARFFEKIKDGDVLIIYPQSKRLYVYRQSTGEIITQAVLTDSEVKTNLPTANFSLQGIVQTP